MNEMAVRGALILLNIAPATRILGNVAVQGEFHLSKERERRLICDLFRGKLIGRFYGVIHAIQI
jgi:hypothetical protein